MEQGPGPGVGNGKGRGSSALCAVTIFTLLACEEWIWWNLLNTPLILKCQSQQKSHTDHGVLQSPKMMVLIRTEIPWKKIQTLTWIWVLLLSCVMCWEGKVHETFFLTLLKSLMFATWTWHYMFFQTNISITKTNKTWNKNWHWSRVNLSCGFWSSLWVSPLPHMCSASCTSLRRDPGCSCTFWFCHLHLSLPGLRGTPPISTKAIVITARDL